MTGRQGFWLPEDRRIIMVVEWPSITKAAIGHEEGILQNS